MLISLVEYAKLHGRAESTARQMARTGGFQTAKKVGRNWVIEDSEEWPDRRITSGLYVGKKRNNLKKLLTALL